jgi:hypothetical protein
MPDHRIPHSEVSAVLDSLLAEAQIVLGGQMVALYLYGSLSSGDFNPHSSDIDFVFITEGYLPDATIAALEAMHQRLWGANGLSPAGSKWAAKLEGAYVPRDLIRAHDPDGRPVPIVNEGEFYRDQLGSDWIIQRHVVRESGVVLYGPPPDMLIEPVSPDVIREAVRGVLREWWAGIGASVDNLRRTGYSPFAVLTMCRASYALEYGAIVSKPEAARWMLESGDERWETLIRQALAAWESGGDIDMILEVQAFIAETVQEVT